MLSDQEIQERVVRILTPYVKQADALAKVGLETHILDDLRVNSARLVDVVLAFEDDFEISIADEDVDAVATVGDCVALIRTKLA
jgi:acyl carrier protein